MQGWPDEFHVIYRDKKCLMDRYALAAWAEVSVRTVQRRCVVVGHYKGRAMYDQAAAEQVLFPAYRRGELTRAPVHPQATTMRVPSLQGSAPNVGG